jgi:3-isopropylmalate dehydratase small subunit
MPRQVYTARVFYRSAINLGLPVLVSPDAAAVQDRAMVRNGGLIPNLRKLLAKSNPCC